VEKKDQIEPRIIRDKDFWLLYKMYWSNEEYHKFSEFLNRENPTKGPGNIVSSRVMTHWYKKGLLEDKRPTGKGWRKHSILSLVWLRIILTLRKFGVSLDNIGKVGESLDEVCMIKAEPDDTEMTDANKIKFLEYYVAQLLVDKKPAFFLVFDDFSCDIANLNEIQKSRDLGLCGDFIQISLNTIVKEILPELEVTKADNIYELSLEEITLLTALRFEKVESITVRTKRGKIDLIEKKYVKDAQTKLHEMIKEGGYQSVEMLLENGKVVSCVQTKKEKVGRKK
jgi:DNA-binding transcriptional MerR regulator